MWVASWGLDGTVHDTAHPRPHGKKRTNKASDKVCRGNEGGDVDVDETVLRTGREMT